MRRERRTWVGEVAETKGDRKQDSTGDGRSAAEEGQEAGAGSVLGKLKNEPWVPEIQKSAGGTGLWRNEKEAGW